MKMSVSVPDELWAAVHPDGARPSDTVQRGLQALAAATASTQRPLAHAPDQANLDRYRSEFEWSVERSTEQIQTMRDGGYRLGLILAWGLEGSDFDNLDDDHAEGELQEIVSWSGDYADGEVFSAEFCDHIRWVLSARTDEGFIDPDMQRSIQEVLGDENHPQPGVRWGEELASGPVLSDTFTNAVTAALLDVRAEAIRRLNAAPSPEGEGPGTQP
jgi:hypothetical protein